MFYFYKKIKGSMLLISALFLLSGCQTIASFNAISFSQVTSLKAAHIKLLDDNLNTSSNTYSIDSIKTTSNNIDLKFREAIEFSKSLKTDLRTDNLEYLKEVFEADIKLLVSKERLLKQEEFDTAKTLTNLAYDLVVEGECARPHGKCKTN